LGTGNEEGREFDTPTLIEVWRTAPYLYDGRALTMQELLKGCNPQDKHGTTQNLTDEEVDALAEFVLSL
jgi:cytochrome c peroxidase